MILIDQLTGEQGGQRHITTKTFSRDREIMRRILRAPASSSVSLCGEFFYEQFTAEDAEASAEDTEKNLAALGFAQKVDPIWSESVITGSAGALARSTLNLKPLTL